MTISVKTDQVVLTSSGKPLPTKVDDPLIRFLFDELKRLQTIINQLAQAALVVADVEPTQPRRGMVRYAVAPWDPLGTGYEGLVQYDGTAWAAV